MRAKNVEGAGASAWRAGNRPSACASQPFWIPARSPPCV